MSTRVVSESHMTGDDYAWVPSTEDVEAIETEVRKLSGDVSGATASIEAFEHRLEAQDGRVRKAVETAAGIADKVATLKAAIEAELINGKWRDNISRVVRNATESFEQKIRETNQTSADQISELVKHEVSVRTLVEELSRLRDAATSEIASRGALAQKELETMVSNVLEQLKRQEVCFAKDKASVDAGIEKLNCVQSLGEQVSAEFKRMEDSVGRIKDEAESVMKKIDERGAEASAQIENCADKFGKLDKLNFKLNIQLLITIILFAVAIVVALLK